MGVSKYDIVATNFDRNKADQLELSILLGMDSFNYILLDPATRQLMAFKSVQLNTPSFTDWVPFFYRSIQADEFLGAGLAKTVYLSIHTERLCLLPQRLFQEGEETNYLSRLTDISLDDRCRSDFIPSAAAQLVYAIGEERLEAIKRRLSPRRIQHCATALLEQWLAQSQALNHKALYACLRDRMLSIAALHNGQLLFFNVFTFQTAAEVVYYVHLAYQQCGWSAARMPLYLCGEVVEDSDIYQQLYRFVEDIRFLQPPAELALIERNIASVPSHLYYDVLCQIPQRLLA